mmetsp:Transcript_109780/g.153832  ORF Transcript_109780/g.153832 Transcript_109780/m.153832 type:complete len:149 (-) Transcript_109780:26-472(-)|eukprot:symbB.v1.2.022544.t1/scaffold2009.1/size92556/3
MPEIAPGVSYGTLAREWRCKWSYDDDCASLKACQKLLQDMQDEILEVIHQWAGKQLKTREVMNGKVDSSLQSVQRIVGQACCDFKVIIKLPTDKFEEWGSRKFDPEEKFLESLRAIPGVEQVQTQTYTLETVNLFAPIVPKASKGCMA